MMITINVFICVVNRIQMYCTRLCSMQLEIGLKIHSLSFHLINFSLVHTCGYPLYFFSFSLLCLQLFLYSSYSFPFSFQFSFQQHRTACLSSCQTKSDAINYSKFSTRLHNECVQCMFPMAGVFHSFLH